MLQNRRETRVLRLILAHAVHTGRTFLRLGFAIVNIDKVHSCALSKYILALCHAYNGALPPLRDVDAHKVEGKAPKGAIKLKRLWFACSASLPASLSASLPASWRSQGKRNLHRTQCHKAQGKARFQSSARLH